MAKKFKKASIAHARAFRHKPKPTDSEIVPELQAAENSIHGFGDPATNFIDVDGNMTVDMKEASVEKIPRQNINLEQARDRHWELWWWAGMEYYEKISCVTTAITLSTGWRKTCRKHWIRFPYKPFVRGGDIGYFYQTFTYSCSFSRYLAAYNWLSFSLSDKGVYLQHLVASGLSVDFKFIGSSMYYLDIITPRQYHRLSSLPELHSDRVDQRTNSRPDWYCPFPELGSDQEPQISNYWQFLLKMARRGKTIPLTPAPGWW